MRGRSLGPEYATIVFLEMQHYYTLQGVARIEKGVPEFPVTAFP